MVGLGLNAETAGAELFGICTGPQINNCRFDGINVVSPIIEN